MAVEVSQNAFVCRAIQGIGYKMDVELRQLGMETADDLRRWSKADLVRRFGERTGTFLYLGARGKVCAGRYHCLCSGARLAIAQRWMITQGAVERGTTTLLAAATWQSLEMDTALSACLNRTPRQ